MLSRTKVRLKVGRHSQRATGISLMMNRSCRLMTRVLPLILPSMTRMPRLQPLIIREWTELALPDQANQEGLQSPKAKEKVSQEAQQGVRQ